jgi:hypothetical protein
MISSIKFENTGNVKKAILGKGSILMGDDLDELLKLAMARKELINSAGLQYTRRKNAAGNVYFINNRSNKEVNDWVALQTHAAGAALFSAMSTEKGVAKWRKENNGNISVQLQLQPWESVIVQTYTTQKTGTAYPYWQSAGESTEITGNWSIEFISGGPTLPFKIETAQLKSWTAMGGEDLRNFSGTAKYAISFPKPAGDAKQWLLDLGELYSTAEVRLNGQLLTTLIGPGFKVNIPSSQLKATNTLEVIVSNLMANRIAYMDRNNLPWKIFYNTNMPARRRENIKNGLFDASSWQPMLSGLIGPVILAPLKLQ